MTPKQQRFVTEYLLDLNATQAAIRAGYRHGDVGRQLLTKTHVSNAIAEAQRHRAERTRIAADTVVQRLWDEATREGKGSSHGARVQALTTLAKHFGLLEPKQPLAVDVTSGGKSLSRDGLTVEDVAAAAALVAAAGLTDVAMMQPATTIE